MTLTVKHAFTSAIADDPAASAAGEVLPSHWNASHVVSGLTLRDILTTNRNYFVSATGSDSNDGLTIGTAWATLQHAMLFIAGNLDIAGFVVIVNIGAGSFVGFGALSCVGGGAILFTGAGSASTTITGGANDGIINFGECFDADFVPYTLISINKVTFQPSAGNYAFAVYVRASAFIGDGAITFSADVKFDISSMNNTSSVVLSQDVGAEIALQPGPISISGAGNPLAVFRGSLGGAIVNFSNPAISGGPTWASGYIVLTEGAQYIEQGNQPTGSATGPRFALSVNSAIVGNSDPAGTFYPGNAVGTLDRNATYQGITDFTGSVASLPASVRNAEAFVTDANSTTFGAIVAGSGANYVPVYADGTNWRIG